MRKWPLQRKIGFFAALFSLGTGLLGFYAIKPLVYRHQVAELDRELLDNAEEIIRDIKNFSRAPDDYIRKPIEDRFIPPALRRRYLHIVGPEGQKLWKSPNLGATELPYLPSGYHTKVLAERNCRFFVYQYGYVKIIVGTRLGTVESVQEDISQASLIVAPLLGICIFFGAWAVVKWSLRPVRLLTAAADRIQAGQASERLPYPEARDDIYDLTEVLNNTFDRLQAAYEAVARFSADASHQLKTPLSVLRAGLDDLGKNDHFTAEDQEEISILRKQTRRLTGLVNDLLLLAQIDAGRFRLEPKEINLTDVLLASADDTAVLCETKDLEFQLPDLPERIPCLADTKRLEIILQNLLENAVKYTPSPGWVRLSLHQRDPDQADAPALAIRVANSGGPIPPDAQPKLFDRFYRANTGENIAGHGLGLNISRQLARAMGWELRLVKSDHQETVFELNSGKSLV